MYIWRNDFDVHVHSYAISTIFPPSFFCSFSISFFDYPTLVSPMPVFFLPSTRVPLYHVLEMECNFSLLEIRLLYY